MSFIFDFEDSVLRHARERGVDGVICGHIHAATIRDQDGITYINCGDWVDSCTAIVEHQDGRMELLLWEGESENLVVVAPVAAGSVVNGSATNAAASFAKHSVADYVGPPPDSGAAPQFTELSQ